MEDFEAFEAYLSEMLAHLYDPTYRPPDALWAALGLERQQGLPAIQHAIVQAIETLKPAGIVPLTARSWRIYGLLAYRYIYNFTQEETADRLNITSRHLRRERAEAVHALALHLWEKSRAEMALVKSPSGQNAALDDTTSAEHLSEWYLQIKTELAALQETTPGAVADVVETLDRSVKLVAPLLARRNATLHLDMKAPRLIAAIHPSALRQVLISAIEEITGLMASGELTIEARTEQNVVKILIHGRPVLPERILTGQLMREILADQGGTYKIIPQREGITISLELVHVDRTVLIVDDNIDMIHLYRRYTAGSRYHIIHAPQGSQATDLVQSLMPDVVVLDVMLPDADGWELLSRLHENPATASIPVVICTVMHEKELALALGAAQFLTKPVQRQQFIEALDNVFSPD
jgi:CheY-like chemotaxis protein